MTAVNVFTVKRFFSTKEWLNYVVTEILKQSENCNWILDDLFFHFSSSHFLYHTFYFYIQLMLVCHWLFVTILQPLSSLTCWNPIQDFSFTSVKCAFTICSVIYFQIVAKNISFLHEAIQGLDFFSKQVNTFPYITKLIRKCINEYWKNV